MKNSDESNVYNFNYKERGIALLIHNEHFKKLPPRPGDDTDRKHMKKVFKSMGFKVCSFKNLKKSQMLQLADDSKYCNMRFLYFKEAGIQVNSRQQCGPL